MISAWKRRDNYWTNIDSPDFVQEQMYTGYLETQRHGLSSLDVHKKNNLWMLWESAPKPLRQEGSADTRFLMWGCTDIPGGGSPTGIMQEVRESEAGGTGLDCRQSLLHEEVCPLCRAEVSDDDHTGCSQRVEKGICNNKVIPACPESFFVFRLLMPLFRRIPDYRKLSGLRE